MAKNNQNVKLIASLYDEVILNPLEASIYTLEGVFKFSDFWRLSPAHTYAHTVSTQRVFSHSLKQEISANNYSSSNRDSAF